MSAFCVFGVSREICRTAVAKQQPVFLVGPSGRRDLTPQEWGAEVERIADRVFNETTKIGRISPEFDSPQFCKDWIAVSPDQVKLTQIMVRIPAFDKQGGGKDAEGCPSHGMGALQRNRKRSIASVAGRSLRAGGGQ